MPLLNLKCTKEIPEDMLGQLSSAISLTLEKPDKFTMVVVEKASMLMGGAKGDAAYAEVKAIGELDRIAIHEVTMKICILLNDHLGIPADRIYVTFQSVDADRWGWNGTLFE